MYWSYSARVVNTLPSGAATGVNGSGVNPSSGVVGSVVSADFSSPAGGGVAVPPRRPGIAASSNRLASTPTAPPTVADSPAPSTSSCSGAYTPLAIAFWATCWAASVPASVPPDNNARLINPSPLPPGNAASAMSTAASIAPGAMPNPVAVARCSSVASACSARTRASPAPAAVPIPIPAATPGSPRNANGAIGRSEPIPSPT